MNRKLSFFIFFTSILNFTNAIQSAPSECQSVYIRNKGTNRYLSISNKSYTDESSFWVQYFILFYNLFLKKVNDMF